MIQDVSKIKNKSDFLRFLKELSEDFIINKDGWENWTIDNYLKAIEAYIEGGTLEKYYENTNQKFPHEVDWKLIAGLFYVGKIYE